MRKADYAHLADIIRAQLDLARRYPAGADIVHTLEHVARAFAAAASVDRKAFLKACGIE